MAIKNSIKNVTEPFGYTSIVECPECKNELNMPLFRNYDTFNPIAILKQEDKQLGIAVCPKCAAVYIVSERYIKALLAGQTVFVTHADLTRVGKKADE